MKILETYSGKGGECSVKGCHGKAAYGFAARVSGRKIRLCAECAAAMFDDLSRAMVPKSPRNKIASGAEEREGVIRSGG